MPHRIHDISPLLSGTLAVLALAVVGCGGSTPTRKENYRVTVGRTIASAGVTYCQVGEEPKKQAALEMALNGCSDSTYRDVDGSLADPVIASFGSAYDSLLALENDRNLTRRAIALKAARNEFQAIADGTGTPRLIALAAQVNVVCCDIALGDTAAFRSDRAKLPPERDRTSKTSIATDSFGLLTGSDAVKQDAILANVSAMRCDAPASGTVLVQKKIIYRVLRTVTPAVAPAFQFTDNTQSAMTFPAIVVTLVPFDASRARLTLSLTAENKTVRVVSLADMAVRLQHRGQITTYRTAEAAYRLLPGDRAQIRLTQKDATAMDDFRQVLGGASEGASTLTLFDAPIEFDALGAVTKKENVTWSFSYTPGSDAVTELDPTKSTYEWMEFLRGIDRPILTHDHAASPAPSTQGPRNTFAGGSGSLTSTLDALRHGTGDRHSCDSLGTH